eukprot:scaffold36189_cov160-Amphora_coffeaeformis.AAC.1
MESVPTGGEAESYHGIKVTYVHGKTAILTIYEDGNEKEKIVLHELSGGRPALHALMKEKGFQKKSAQKQPYKYITHEERNAKEDTYFQKKAEEEGKRPPTVVKAATLSEDRKQSLRHAMLTDLHNKREEEGSAIALLRRREKEQLLAMAGPKDSTMMYLTLAGCAAAVGLSIIGMMSRRGKKSRTGVRK